MGEILDFVPRAYWEVEANFGIAAGEYLGKWIDPAFKKDEKDSHKRAERIWDQNVAEEIYKRCEGKTGVVTEKKKPTKQACPLLYDLTSLQREASSRLTDSKYLPEDYIGNVHSTMDSIAADSPTLGKHAAHAVKNKLIVKTKKVFDNKKISDHHAIIPTGRFVKLDDAAQKIFDLVTKRFIAIFYPSAVFEVTERTTIITTAGVEDNFRTNGKVLIDAGWLAVYGRSVGDSSGKEELVPAVEGESTKTESIESVSKETKPPAYYNEATLLSAMEGAGKLVEDEDLKDAMAGRGLGTPATRAAIIEGLLRQKYLARDARDIHVTPSGLNLISLIDEIGIHSLASPSMTGDWEYKLHQIEEGSFDRDAFMEEVLGFTGDIVQKAKGYAEELRNQSFPDLEADCPTCNVGPMRQTDSHYECKELECKFRAGKYIAGRLLKIEEAEELFAKKFVGPLTGFKSRFNKPFDAALEITEDGKVSFFKEKVDLSEAEKVDTITLADGKSFDLLETENSYFAPDLANKKNPDGFKLPKVILQQEINHEQIKKMLIDGKTDLLEGFISNRTKKPFPAHLDLAMNFDKLGFDWVFPPRPAKKAAKKTAKKAAKKAAKKK